MCWNDNFRYTPDSAKVRGDGTDGSLYSTGIFAEAYAPIFDNGSQALALKAGVRWDDDNLFGDDTTTYQLGVEFNVIESLKLRATAGTAFRAPTIQELFDGFVDEAPPYIDRGFNASTDPTTYRMFDTGYFFRISQTFD